MLVIITTHPIQYQVPLWQKLAEYNDIAFEVWYLTDFGLNGSYDKEFGKSFAWDLPLLSGYQYQFLKVNSDASPNKGFTGIRLKEDIKKKFKECGATHVFINGWQVLAYWEAVWAAKSLGLVTILRGESNDLKPESKWKWPVKKFLLNQFFSRIDFFLYIGSANKRFYRNKYRIPEEKLFPGLYSIDNHRFKDLSSTFKAKRRELREFYGIPQESFCILFCGKLISKKRPFDIIKALEQVSDKGSYHIFFVGTGELYDAIKERCNIVFEEVVKKAKVDSSKVNVSLAGFLNQTEIPKAYSLADCLVLPSDFNETWGLVVNEAMTCGIPAIISDQCGSAEDLGKGLNPYLIYPCGDTEKLKTVIEFLRSHPIDVNTITNYMDKYNYRITIDSIKKILLNNK